MGMTRLASPRRRSVGPALAALLALALLGLCPSSARPQPPAELEKGFLNPPDSAKPHTWWHWVDGNISRLGITLDLEEMKRVGLGGAQIFDVAVGIPAGPVAYMSDAWRALVNHAAEQAARLGLELALHNCAGWSSSGGPWIKPEQAMQMLVVSELRVRGPQEFDGPLPQPPTRRGFYRDVAVLAYPTPPCETLTMAEARPKITSSAPDLDSSKLTDGNQDTIVTLPLPTTPPGAFIQVEFAQPFTARAVTIAPGWGASASGELQASDDGARFRKVADFFLSEPTLLGAPVVVTFAPTTARYFRLLFARSGRRGAAVRLAEVTLKAGQRLRDWPAKAGYFRANNLPLDPTQAPPEAVIHRAQIVDLTARLTSTGRLVWSVPPGHWTILRFGHTCTGKENHPAAPAGRGLECDKLSKEAVEAHFQAGLGKLLADLTPLAARGLKHVLIDSYEVDCQNWTPRFREEFQARRGYDPLPFLPAMAGRIVESVAVSERFLWDVRRTIADLFAENYYGHFARLCHAHGLSLSVEPYGNGGFDDLTAGGQADIPMSEFWVNGWGNDNQGSKLASSIAHTYGKRIVGAESFTADASHGRWQNHPYALKPLGDLMYCGGVNRFIFHRYAHQPWPDLKPGMTMGPWGFHFERTVTWWSQSRAWLAYLARCQYLLQSGLFVADLCYFSGEGAPYSPPARPALNPPPPPGYDYDVCNAEVLLSRMSVSAGRLALPDGMTYRLLVLPPDRTMTPPVLRKIQSLVAAGAAVLGPKPLSSPSLQDWPECDRQVQALADEIWGPCDGSRVTEHKYGRGKVFWGKPLAEVLAALEVPPDFELTAHGPWQPLIHYIHRRAGSTEIYFVCNQNRRPEVVEASFRVTGKVPELWHPDTGLIEPAPLYRQQAGRTIVPLRFDPAGSVFVVFRKPSASVDHFISWQRDGAPVFSTTPPRRGKLHIVQALYGVLVPRSAEAVDVTSQLRERVRDGRLSVRADNSLAGDPAPDVVKQLWVEYAVGGQVFTKTVDEGQLLTIPEPGQAGPLELRRAIYGVLPENPPDALRPRVVDVTEILRRRVQNDTLCVRADNSLAGDPAPFVIKQMRVDYTLDGEPYTRVVDENETLVLPDGTEGEHRYFEPPPPHLALTPPRGAVLTAWQPGLYEAVTASGKRFHAKVPSLPAPLELTGPWQLRFPPNLGAPPQAVFKQLVSWTDSPDPGIKYFSGTASYFYQLNLPPDLFKAGTVLMLDLGAVHEIAEVRLNDQDLGILWKPPFRVELTGAARPGTNLLEVRVTNLWPNRLIGDEQFPDDCEFTPGGALKAWPAWLLAGQPRPVKERICFTTWKHYSQDMPLLKSGLLGPVRLLVGRKVALAPA
jgi:hypothetical protein